MSDGLPAPSAKTVVAAFDFDGTLARGDSLLPFLMQLLGGRRVARSVLAHAPSFGLIALGKGDRDKTKERFIAYTLTGQSADEIRALGKEFSRSLLATRMFPEVMERVRWHKEQGHRLVMVSASLDVFLEPTAAKLGFDSILTTRIEIKDGRATGRLIGVNVRAAEKARLLQQHLANDDVELWAYGNSSGDKELLEMADHPFWVNLRGTISPWPVTTKQPTRVDIVRDWITTRVRR